MSGPSSSKNVTTPARRPVSSDATVTTVVIPMTIPRMVSSERNRLVHAALRSLPESLRSVLLWQFFDERSLEEIAAQLNRPVATVKSRRHRARLELRKRFAKRLQTADLSMALS